MFIRKRLTILSISIAALLCSCASGKRLDFLDAGGGRHKILLDQNAPFNFYKKENFKIDWTKISYEDENYYSKLGIDISHHDADVDWKRVRAWGAEFVILRVGYRGYQSGKVILDRKFHQNIKGALDAGLEVGVYFFSQAINREEALEEAETVLEQIKDYKITLPVVFDPENILNDTARTDNVSGRVFTANAIAFCQRVKEAGYTPMVYMNMLWQSEKFDLAALKDFQFWFADYEKIPQTPYAFTIWQYSCMGLVDGVKIPGAKDCLVDLDLMILPKE